MDMQELGWGNKDWIDLAEDRDRWQALVNAVLNFRVFCSKAVSKPVWHIGLPLLCVQWKTPDGGQRNCTKHVEFYSKNKFEKLVHLVGFIIIIYWILSCQNICFCLHSWRAGKCFVLLTKMFSCKILIFCLILNKFVFLTYFHKRLQCQISRKTVHWEPSWYRATGGRFDGHDVSDRCS